MKNNFNEIFSGIDMASESWAWKQFNSNIRNW